MSIIAELVKNVIETPFEAFDQLTLNLQYTITSTLLKLYGVKRMVWGIMDSMLSVLSTC
jgi:hypothetical protein